ncbi:MAG: hypothetical protein HND47_14215 [Chloroflexi bacterium]|nr:hypothetical protein [Chloroflexota bacterium]
MSSSRSQKVGLPATMTGMRSAVPPPDPPPPPPSPEPAAQAVSVNAKTTNKGKSSFFWNMASLP